MFILKKNRQLSIKNLGKYSELWKERNKRTLRNEQITMSSFIEHTVIKETHQDGARKVVECGDATCCHASNFFCFIVL
jgi:hypothetical protein